MTMGKPICPRGKAFRNVRYTFWRRGYFFAKVVSHYGYEQMNNDFENSKEYKNAYKWTDIQVRRH